MAEFGRLKIVDPQLDRIEAKLDILIALLAEEVGDAVETLCGLDGEPISGARDPGGEL